MTSYVEEQFLVPCGVKGMSDDSRAKHLLPKGDDNEGVHIEGHSKRYHS